MVTTATNQDARRARRAADDAGLVVEAAGLTKVFRDFWMREKARAVDKIDFDIHRGEIFGLLGPNGSGKSTTIKMILGLLRKTSGRLVVFGRDPADVVTKKYIGFLPEESYLYRYLDARETLDYYGKLFGIDRRTRRRRTDELLEMVGLSHMAHRAVGEYSKGMTRRIGIAQALVNDPEFLILDEPTSGLDPIGTRQVKDLLLELKRRGKTILLSSHLLADVEDVCDRMVMLYGGRVRAEGTSDELLADRGHTVIRTSRLKPETIEALRAMVQELEPGDEFDVEAPRQRLEQLFLEIVERAQAENVETSGARHGAGTAAFLRGEAEASGEGLIDALVTDADAAASAEAESAKVVEKRRGPAPVEADAGPAEDVLADLVGGDDANDDTGAGADDAAGARRRPGGGPVPDAPADVDGSVIDALLGDGSGRDGDADDDDRDRRDRRDDEAPRP